MFIQISKGNVIRLDQIATLYQAPASKVLYVTLLNTSDEELFSVDAEYLKPLLEALSLHSEMYDGDFNQVFKA